MVNIGGHSAARLSALFVPAFEGVACAGGNGNGGRGAVELGDGHVDIQSVGSDGLLVGADDGVCFVVLVPGDEGVRRLLDIDILGAEHEGVDGFGYKPVCGIGRSCVVWVTGHQCITGVVGVAPFQNVLLCVGFIHGERVGGVDARAGDVLKESVRGVCSIVALHDPVRELLGGVGRCAGVVRYGVGVVLILVGCGVAGGGASVAVVNHRDAYGTGQGGLPFAVDVILAGNPETFGVTGGRGVNHGIGVPSGSVAILIHHVGEVGGLVVGDCVSVVKRDGVFVERVGACRVGEPAYKLPVVVEVNSGGDTDVVVIVSAEVHGLAARTPV